MNNTVTISVVHFEELVEIKAKMESLVDYLNCDGTQFPNIEAIRAIIGA